ncbi:MAG: hypothetical protein IT462_15435 [Planctomycetes bacterium]|nr:hypothetical protein [Planctomycetota bacterium]
MLFFDGMTDEVKPAKKKRRRTGAWVFHFWPTRLIVELYLRVFAFSLTLFGHRWAYWWARRLAALAWLVLPKLRNIALRNLELCFPQKSEAERLAIAKGSFRHFCYTLCDVLLVPKYFRGENWRRYYELVPDDDPYFEVFRRDAPVFYLSAHFGNWEVASFSVNRLKLQRLLVIMRPMVPPYVNRKFVRLREHLGNEVVEKEGAAGRGFARAIRDKRKLAVLVDQNGGDFAPVETFFGVPCTWQADFAKLAVRAGTIVNSVSYRDGDRFKFAMEDSIVRYYTRDDDPMQIVRDYRDYLERVIAAHPEQYFWMHKRFKARKTGWPDRYANLHRRLTADERAAMLNVAGTHGSVSANEGGAPSREDTLPRVPAKT